MYVIITRVKKAVSRIIYMIFVVDCKEKVYLESQQKNLFSFFTNLEHELRTIEFSLAHQGKDGPVALPKLNSKFNQ